MIDFTSICFSDYREKILEKKTLDKVDAKYFLKMGPNFVDSVKDQLGRYPKNVGGVI